MNETGSERRSSELNRSLEVTKKAHICRVFEACGRDPFKAAELLEITPEEVMHWIGAAEPGAESSD